MTINNRSIISAVDIIYFVKLLSMLACGVFMPPILFFAVNYITLGIGDEINQFGMTISQVLYAFTQVATFDLCLILWLVTLFVLGYIIFAARCLYLSVLFIYSSFVIRGLKNDGNIDTAVVSGGAAALGVCGPHSQQGAVKI
jgi:hypothetical protein